MATIVPYSAWIFGALTQERINLETEGFKLVLVNDTYNPNPQDTTYGFASIATHEVSGTGYTSGGKTITGTGTSYDALTDLSTFKADDVVFNGLQVTARYGIVLSPADSFGNLYLICWIDFEENQVVDGTLTIEWPGDGIFTIGRETS